MPRLDFPQRDESPADGRHSYTAIFERGFILPKSSNTTTTCRWQRSQMQGSRKISVEGRTMSSDGDIMPLPLQRVTAAVFSTAARGQRQICTRYKFAVPGSSPGDPPAAHPATHPELTRQFTRRTHPAAHPGSSPGVPTAARFANVKPRQHLK